MQGSGDRLLVQSLHDAMKAPSVVTEWLRQRYPVHTTSLASERLAHCIFSPLGVCRILSNIPNDDGITLERKPWLSKATRLQRLVSEDFRSLLDVRCSGKNLIFPRSLFSTLLMTLAGFIRAAMEARKLSAAGQCCALLAVLTTRALFLGWLFDWLAHGYDLKAFPCAGCGLWWCLLSGTSCEAISGGAQHPPLSSLLLSPLIAGRREFIDVLLALLQTTVVARS